MSFSAGSTLLRVFLSCLAAGCGGRMVRLGDSQPPTYHFGPPVLVAELASAGRNDNPTLTSDMLEIYFTSTRNAEGHGDVWFAKRPSARVPFGAPEMVAGVNSDSYETSSAISPDGLTLWFGSDRPGGAGSIDIWVSQRTSRSAAWSEPVNVASLNSPAEDIPRPPGMHALVMPLASTKISAANPSDGNYQTYFAGRAERTQAFSSPSPIPELAFADRSTVDAFLTDDGLTMFFSSSSAPPEKPDGGVAIDAATLATRAPDLFVAFRRSANEPFSAPVALSDLNTAADDRDPWLSPDGSTLYFVSDRSGGLAIYTAAVSVTPARSAGQDARALE